MTIAIVVLYAVVIILAFLLFGALGLIHEMRRKHDGLVDATHAALKHLSEGSTGIEKSISDLVNLFTKHVRHSEEVDGTMQRAVQGLYELMKIEKSNIKRH